MHSNLKTINDLRWSKIPLLSDGFICLVDAMGDDSDIVQAARVSYNGDTRDDQDRLNEILAKRFGKIETYNPEQIAVAKVELISEERKLLRYLMRHRHTTPCEQAEVKFLIRVPMDTWRQMVRHRTANINEYSTRYVEAIDSRDKTEKDQWRLQSKSNKQGSVDTLEDWPGDFEHHGDVSPGEYLSAREAQFHEQADDLYKERLKFGVAKEQARKDLPLSTYTEAYWKCDLHNILHYLGLRMDSHAQLEIRTYANAIGSIIQKLYPMTWEAFIDYRLESMTLSRLDKLVIKYMSVLAYTPTIDKAKVLINMYISDKREAAECLEKLLDLNVVKE